MSPTGHGSTVPPVSAPVLDGNRTIFRQTLLVQEEDGWGNERLEQYLLTRCCDSLRPKGGGVYPPSPLSRVYVYSRYQNLLFSFIQNRRPDYPTPIHVTTSHCDLVEKS